jgi:hypothetical protein
MNSNFHRHLRTIRRSSGIAEPAPENSPGTFLESFFPVPACPSAQKHAGPQTFSAFGMPSSLVRSTLKTGYSNSATSGFLWRRTDTIHPRSGKRLRRNFSARARPSAQITRSTRVHPPPAGAQESLIGLTHLGRIPLGPLFSFKLTCLLPSGPLNEHLRPCVST